MTSHGLTPSDKEFIRDYVADASTEEEKQARRREVAESFGVSLSAVASITAWTKIRAKSTCNLDDDGKTVITDHETMPQPSCEESTPELQRVQKVSEGGAHMNYDNEVKRAWRNKIMAYIADNTPVEGRSRKKVLCFPGKRCLEIPAYLALGFSPENIIGYEGGDKAAREEFSRNAVRLGITPRIGRMEDLLESDDTHFDVVNLDFTGQMCPTYSKIIGLVKLSDHAVVCTNMMAARENATTQEFMRSMYRASADKHDINITSALKIQAFFDDIMSPGEVKEELKIVRDEASAFAVMNCFQVPSGFDRAIFGREIQDLYKKFSDHFRLPLADFVCAAQKYLAMVLEVMRFHLNKHNLDSSAVARCTQFSNGMVMRSIFGTGFFTNIRKYEYISMAAGRPIRYFSDCLTYDYDSAKFQGFKKSVEFFFRVIRYFTELAIAQDKLVPDTTTESLGTVDKNGLPIQLMINPNKDVLVFRGMDQTVVARLNVNKWSKDIDTYRPMRKGDILEETWLGKMDFPRELIEG